MQKIINHLNIVFGKDYKTKDELDKLMNVFPYNLLNMMAQINEDPIYEYTNILFDGNPISNIEKFKTHQITFMGNNREQISNLIRNKCFQDVLERIANQRVIEIQENYVLILANQVINEEDLDHIFSRYSSVFVLCLQKEQNIQFEECVKQVWLIASLGLTSRFVMMCYPNNIFQGKFFRKSTDEAKLQFTIRNNKIAQMSFLKTQGYQQSEWTYNYQTNYGTSKMANRFYEGKMKNWQAEGLGYIKQDFNQFEGIFKKQPKPIQGREYVNGNLQTEFKFVDQVSKQYREQNFYAIRYSDDQNPGHKKQVFVGNTYSSGLILYPNGSVYEGQLSKVALKQDGMGVLYDKTNQKVINAIFQNGHVKQYIDVNLNKKIELWVIDTVTADDEQLHLLRNLSQIADRSVLFNKFMYTYETKKISPSEIIQHLKASKADVINIVFQQEKIEFYLKQLFNLTDLRPSIIVVNLINIALSEEILDMVTSYKSNIVYLQRVSADQWDIKSGLLQTSFIVQKREGLDCILLKGEIANLQVILDHQNYFCSGIVAKP